MAEVKLVNVKKLYPFVSGEEKKSKKKKKGEEPAEEKKVNLQITDKGVVAVLDPRLKTARYGSFLRASLPPFWSTTDPEIAVSALRRLNPDAVA